jgi:hypothetical protein
VTTLGFIFLAFRLVGFEDPRPWAEMTRSVGLLTRYEFHLFAVRQEASYAHSCGVLDVLDLVSVLIHDRIVEAFNSITQ